MNKNMENLPVIDTSEPSLELVSEKICEWEDSKGFRYSAHNYNVETGKCEKCGKEL
jgi:hypothetical protein